MLLSGLIFLACNLTLDTVTELTNINNCILQNYTLTPVSSTETPVSSTETPVSSTETPVSSTETSVSSTETSVSSTETPVSSTETSDDITARYAPTIIAGSGLSLLLVGGIASYFIAKSKKNKDQENQFTNTQKENDGIIDISRPISAQSYPNPRTYNPGVYI